MQNYKRLVWFDMNLTLQLDKVTQKIEKWHENKIKANGEQFERDDDFIETEKSPTNFSSSDEGGGEEFQTYENSPMQRKYKTAVSEQTSPNLRQVKAQGTFKLSLFDAAAQ